MVMQAPLADMRVLAVEQFGAGPWATMQLADLGADVVKIEDPDHGGDVGRSVPPYAQEGSSLYFESFNRNKRSIALDLRSCAGRIAFERLVGSADAVFYNLRGDKGKELRLSYADLADTNPLVVCCSLSGFGQTGPRAGEGAYDHMIQGLAGWMSITGEPGTPPSRSGLPLVDLAAGYVAALALVAAVHRARRDGVGCDCDLSLFETALSLLAYIGTWTATRGFEPERRENSAHQTLVPFQTFAAADGWVVVACPKQHLWNRLCQALGRHDLLRDDRFADFSGRHRHRDALLGELAQEFAGRPVAAWVALLTEWHVPVAPVNDVASALSDSQTRARDAVASVEHPVLGTVRQPASPLRIGGHRAPLRIAPKLGADIAEVLKEWCAMTSGEIASLERRGAFGARKEHAR